MPHHQLTGCICRGKKSKRSVIRCCMGLSHLAVGFRHYLQRGLALVDVVQSQPRNGFQVVDIATVIVRPWMEVAPPPLSFDISAAARIDDGGGGGGGAPGATPLLACSLSFPRR